MLKLSFLNDLRALLEKDEVFYAEDFDVNGSVKDGKDRLEIVYRAKREMFLVAVFNAVDISMRYSRPDYSYRIDVAFSPGNLSNRDDAQCTTRGELEKFIVYWLSVLSSELTRIAPTPSTDDELDEILGMIDTEVPDAHFSAPEAAALQARLTFAVRNSMSLGSSSDHSVPAIHSIAPAPK